MRAAVLQGSRITVEDIPEPVPGPGKVLVAPHRTGICGSDVHLRQTIAELGMTDFSLVPGHEFAGEIVAIGPDTETPLRPGDPVTAIPFTHGPDAPAAIGLSPTDAGGLAELVVVDAVRAFGLPDGLDMRLGTLSEPLAVALAALDHAGATGPIVVVGAGPIGLGIIAAAVSSGRAPVIAVDPAPTRRAMAERLGAEAHEPGTSLLELLETVGYRPDVMSPLLDHDPTPATVFECVGRAEVIESLLAEAPAHSRVVLAGACMHPVQISPVQLTVSEVTVHTSFAYRPRHFTAATELLRREPERFSGLVTSERPLEETEAAFDALAEDPTELKILIDPAGG